MHIVLCCLGSVLCPWTNPFKVHMALHFCMRKYTCNRLSFLQGHTHFCRESHTTQIPQKSSIIQQPLSSSANEVATLHVPLLRITASCLGVLSSGTYSISFAVECFASRPTGSVVQQQLSFSPPMHVTPHTGKACVIQAAIMALPTLTLHLLHHS